MNRRRNISPSLCFLLGAVLFFGIANPTTRAFNGRDVALLNIVIPMFQAGLRAHRNRTHVGDAILQAAAGGLLMQKGFEMGATVSNDDGWKAWRSKLLVNAGASLAESAGKRLGFRMDIGPFWVLWEGGVVRVRPGLHAMIAPFINSSEGSRFNLSRSLRLGTLTFDRRSNGDGTIGTRGALAYSNANNIITNHDGSHFGHELIHTFQYRRDSFLCPRLGNLVPEIGERTAGRWVDDTGWSINWGVQCLGASIDEKSRDFDILMEREAYYLTRSGNCW